MPEAKFEIFRDSQERHRFRLVAPNGEIIAQSQGYGSKSGCLEGIASVVRNAPDAKHVDLTRGEEATAGPRFEIFKDAQDRFRFRLTAANNEIIAQSQGYDQKVSCVDGSYSVMNNAPRARTVDLTLQPVAKPAVTHGMGWVIMCRLVQYQHFRARWWNDTLTGRSRRRFPKRCV